MTLSPEERAREIAQSILLSPCSIPFLGTVTPEKIIAAALRAAENEALERAARTLEDEKAKIEPPMSYAMTNFCMGLQHGATAIRALKTGE